MRLYNPRFGDEANSSLQVGAATVDLYASPSATMRTAKQSVGQLAATGTDATFRPARARAVKVSLDHVTGTFYGTRVAGLAEIEVIACSLDRSAAGRPGALSSTQ